MTNKTHNNNENHGHNGAADISFQSVMSGLSPAEQKAVETRISEAEAKVEQRYTYKPGCCDERSDIYKREVDITTLNEILDELAGLTITAEYAVVNEAYANKYYHPDIDGGAAVRMILDEGQVALDMVEKAYDEWSADYNDDFIDEVLSKLGKDGADLYEEASNEWLNSNEPGTVALEKAFTEMVNEGLETQ